MAGAAKLTLDTIKDAKVIDFNYSMGISIDATGRPVGEPRGGTLSITIESTDDTSLPKWMAARKTTKDGSIKIEDQDNKDSTMKTISFTDGHIVSYSEKYTSHGTNNMLQTFTVSAKVLTIAGKGEGVFTNEWPGK